MSRLLIVIFMVCVSFFGQTQDSLKLEVQIGAHGKGLAFFIYENYPFGKLKDEYKYFPIPVTLGLKLVPNKKEWYLFRFQHIILGSSPKGGVGWAGLNYELSFNYLSANYGRVLATSKSIKSSFSLYLGSLFRFYSHSEGYFIAPIDSVFYKLEKLSPSFGGQFGLLEQWQIGQKWVISVDLSGYALLWRNDKYFLGLNSGVTLGYRF